jgi:hypothetical protein
MLNNSIEPFPGCFKMHSLFSQEKNSILRPRFSNSANNTQRILLWWIPEVDFSIPSLEKKVRHKVRKGCLLLPCLSKSVTTFDSSVWGSLLFSHTPQALQRCGDERSPGCWQLLLSCPYKMQSTGQAAGGAQELTQWGLLDLQVHKVTDPCSWG